MSSKPDRHDKASRLEGSAPSPGLAVYTVVVLHYRDEVLLLRRADWKAFAPGRWTGLGGRVEPDELDDIRASAQREVYEETDLPESAVGPLVLRRTLTFHRPDEPTTCLFYYTSVLESRLEPHCLEGDLHWLAPSATFDLDIIETTRPVLPLLIEDIRAGETPVCHGAARYDAAGGVTVVWA